MHTSRELLDKVDRQPVKPLDEIFPFHDLLTSGALELSGREIPLPAKKLVGEVTVEDDARAEGPTQERHAHRQLVYKEDVVLGEVRDRSRDVGERKDVRRKE